MTTIGTQNKTMNDIQKQKKIFLKQSGIHWNKVYKAVWQHWSSIDYIDDILRTIL